jgi:hypothetical protein
VICRRFPDRKPSAGRWNAFLSQSADGDGDLLHGIETLFKVRQTVAGALLHFWRSSGCLRSAPKPAAAAIGIRLKGAQSTVVLDVIMHPVARQY